MIYTLTQLNNQYVEIDGLIDGTTKYLGDGITLNPSPTYINGASGSFTVKDPTGAAVVNGGPIALSYVAGSNGDYRGLLTNGFDPSALGQGYTIFVDLTAPGGFVGHWELPAQVLARRI
jgi:hypothetical protein